MKSLESNIKGFTTRFQGIRKFEFVAKTQFLLLHPGSGSKHVADTVDPEPSMLRIQWIRIQTCCGYSGSGSKHVADTVDSDSDSNQRYIHFTV